MMRGIDALSRREYSRLELYRKLMRTLTEGETADDVIAVLGDLQAKGYLSDERYAEGRVRVRSMRYGNRRVAQELRQQGVDADAITAAMEQTEPEIDRCIVNLSYLMFIENKTLRCEFYPPFQDEERIASHRYFKLLRERLDII